MDILTDDQNFHGNFGRVLGFDNPGLDLPSDFDDVVSKENNAVDFQESSSRQVFPNSLFSAGSTRSFNLVQHTQPGEGQRLFQGHGQLDSPPDDSYISGYGLQQLLHQQCSSNSQQPSFQHHQLQCRSGQDEGTCRQQSNQPNLQDQSSIYYSILGQPQASYSSYSNLRQGSTVLPDSPPDSGSESYSPTDVNIHLQAMNENFQNLPHSQYLGHMKPTLGMPSERVPPVYFMESTALNHHSQKLPLPQHQQNQMMPMMYVTGVQQLSAYQTSDLQPHSKVPAYRGSMPDIAKQVIKKRKYSESPTGTLNTSLMQRMDGVLDIKQEPQAGIQFSNYIQEPSYDFDALSSFDMDSDWTFVEGTNQVIKWQPYLQSKWTILTDSDLKDLPTPHFWVDADKGFNFSVSDEAFVCQKKNHFQVTVHMCLHGNAKYVRTADGIMKIESFYLHVYGVKMESQDQVITIEQSRSDRSKKLFHPIKIDLTADQESKVTLGRLHFSETTSNNMRKKGKPNPDQRYFLLVVSLHAQTGNTQHMMAASVSDQIIVRASNPGQFDSDMDVLWQKGQFQEVIYHMGKVGINTDHPEEALTVHGNLRLTGHMTQPSDMRAKKNIQEINPKNQLENVSKLRIYKYTYRDDYAAQVGIPPSNREDTGVLAQEILGVLPDAVRETGDIILSDGEKIENFLVVNKERIFMENVGAVKELCKLTDNLENRIDQLEKMNKRLRTLKRFDSLKSTASGQSAKSFSTISYASSLTSKNISTDSSPVAAKTTPRNTHQLSSRVNDSRGSSLGDGKSPLSCSFIRSHCKKICRSWFGYIVFGLVLLMAFCLVALACLYILELQKSGSDSTPVTYTEPHLEISTSPNTSLPATASSSSSSTMTTTTVIVTSTRRATTLPPTIRPVYQPILPPYPPCMEGYCEVLCCPSPHEEEPDIIIISKGDNPEYKHVDNTNSEQDGEDVYPDNGEDEHFMNVHSSSKKSSPKETVVVSLSGNSENIKDTGYNVISNHTNNSPNYKVVSQVSNKGKANPAYIYRRRREADVSVKPTIQILELNYSLTEVFCDTCIGNNFTYFVPYNSSFGYSDITLQFSTQTLSYLGLCSSSFLWRCPISEQDDTEIGGLHQQITNGRWKVKIGNHFRTILNFRVVYSLKDKPVNQTETCVIQNSQDFVVLSYTITFQRQCSSPFQR